MEDVKQDAKEVEESSASTDVNKEDSSTSETQVEETGSGDVSSSQDDRLDKNPRFQEVIREKNELKAQLNEVSGKLAQFERQMSSKTSDTETKAEQKRDFVKELEDEGVKPSIAKKIAEMVMDRVENKVKPIEQGLIHASTLQSWMTENKVVPGSETDTAMSDYFNKLKPDEQKWITESGKRGLNYLKAMALQNKGYQADKSSGQTLGKTGGKERGVKDAEYYRGLNESDWMKMMDRNPDEYEKAIKILGARG